MNQDPWPAAIGEALHRAGTNRSLLFDRGFREFKEKGSGLEVPPTAKAGFLASVAGKHGSVGPFLARRRAVMQRLGSHEIALCSQTPLVIGLGLPSPLETGFLFDRLTGCPYLPGSSVKGLARATARLVASGELDGDRAYWQAAFDRAFGPAIGGEALARKGRLVFYDAFPTQWPALAVDVLTPHYGAYYRDPTQVPADWEDPIPVLFLSLVPGTAFTFWVGSSGSALTEDERDKVQRLLVLGLDWLGIGGKRSQGYGAFGPEPPALAVAPPPKKAAQSKKPEVEVPRRPPEKGNFGSMASAKNLAELNKFQGKPSNSPKDEEPR